MPDNYDYHRGLRNALGLDGMNPPDEEKLDKFYSEFYERHPESLTSRRIPLDYKQGDAFVEAARVYTKKFLLKGIPSLFSDLKPLYKDASKAKALETLFEGYCTETTDPELRSDPQVMLWVHHYLAQHYDQMRDTNAALKHIEVALQHTPTVSEVYDAHSKILKHVGDLPGLLHLISRHNNLWRR